MLPKKYRLGRQDFAKVARNKKKYYGELMVLAVARNLGKTSALGVVVAGSVSKKATERNRIRRIIHDAAADFILQKKGFMLVFFVKKSAAGADKRILEKEAQLLLGNVNGS